MYFSCLSIGPCKLFLLVKAPSSFNRPLHFLPKRDFRFSKKVTVIFVFFFSSVLSVYLYMQRVLCAMCTIIYQSSFINSCRESFLKKELSYNHCRIVKYCFSKPREIRYYDVQWTEKVGKIGSASRTCFPSIIFMIVAILMISWMNLIFVIRTRLKDQAIRLFMVILKNCLRGLI